MPKDKEAFEGIPDAYFPAAVQFLQATASANLAPGSIDLAAVNALAALANEEHASLNPQHNRTAIDVVYRTLRNRGLLDLAKATPTASNVTNFGLDLVDLGNFW